MTIWHFEETNNLILVDTSQYWVDTELTLDWFAQEPTRSLVVAGAICIDTLCIIVIIVSGYLSQLFSKSSEVDLSFNRKTHISISTTS